jgi:hypothetical protein
MEYSLLEINEIEAYYNTKLSLAYKTMMMLIGRKVLNNLPYQDSYFRSIYKIQEKVALLTKNDITHGLEKAFFITNILKHRNDPEDLIVYFIEPAGQKDNPVYAWFYNGYSGESSIDKISDGIEDWLLDISCVLYVELQTKKIFSRISFPSD